jgi:hypothetical protein
VTLYLQILQQLYITQVRDIDRQLAEMEAEEAAAAAAETVASRRGTERRGVNGPAEEGVGGGRRAGGQHPQSCNLEQLYHEALPLSKALSHSGPPAFGDTGLFSHTVSYADLKV